MSFVTYLVYTRTKKGIYAPTKTKATAIIFSFYMGIAVPLIIILINTVNSCLLNENFLIVEKNMKINVVIFPVQTGDLKAGTSIVDGKKYDTIINSDTKFIQDGKEQPYIIVNKIALDYSKIKFISSRWKKEHKRGPEHNIVLEVHY